MERKMTVTEASRRFSDLVSRTYYRGDTTVLIRSGEAVARLVPVGPSSVLGKDFAAGWRGMDHLEPADAEEFAGLIEEAGIEVGMPESAWD